MISPVYHNLNTIDSVLKEHFGTRNVELIHPKNQKNFDFIFIIESGEYKVKMVVTETTALMMNNNELSWSYFEDSTNENSSIIHRSSMVSNLGENIQEIFEKKMFSKPYLESVMTSINENYVDAEPILEKPMVIESNGIIKISKKALSEFLDNYNILVEDMIVNDIDQLVIGLSSDVDISPATIVSIESSLKENVVIDNARFGGSEKLYLDFKLPVEIND